MTECLIDLTDFVGLGHYIKIENAVGCFHFFIALSNFLSPNLFCAAVLSIYSSQWVTLLLSFVAFCFELAVGLWLSLGSRNNVACLQPSVFFGSLHSLDIYLNILRFICCRRVGVEACVLLSLFLRVCRLFDWQRYSCVAEPTLVWDVVGHTLGQYSSLLAGIPISIWILFLMCLLLILRLFCPRELNKAFFILFV